MDYLLRLLIFFKLDYRNTLECRYDMNKASRNDFFSHHPHPAILNIGMSNADRSITNENPMPTELKLNKEAIYVGIRSSVSQSLSLISA